MRSAIIADDLTGACDAAARAALAGWRPRVVLDGEPTTQKLVVVSTATRNSTARQAAAIVTEVAQRLLRRGIRPLLKKIDTGLRGPWAAEVAALRKATDAQLVAVAPAFPACGRVVRNGILYADGEEVGALAPALEAAGIHDAIIGDAETDEELAAFAEKIASERRSVLWVGSAGLARYVFGDRHLSPRRLPVADRWLVINGSTHPSSLAAVEAARQAGIEIAESTPESLEPGTALFLIGGDTAERALRHMGASALDVFDEALAGVAVGRVEGGLADGSLFLTKAGHFGNAETVLRAIERCSPERPAVRASNL